MAGEPNILRVLTIARELTPANFLPTLIEYWCRVRSGLPPPEVSPPAGELESSHEAVEEYLTASGYEAGGALLVADPTCQMLLEGTGSLEYRLFAVAVDPTPARIRAAALDQLASPVEDDAAADRVYNVLLAGPVNACVAHKENCAELCTKFLAGKYVAIALLFKFGFRKLGGVPGRALIDTVTELLAGPGTIAAERSARTLAGREDTAAVVRGLRRLADLDLDQLHAAALGHYPLLANAVAEFGVFMSPGSR